MRRKKNYPMIKKYILALSQTVPNETELQEFLEVLCTLLEVNGIYKAQKGETSSIESLRNYCVRVLRNNNWETKIIQYTNYYGIDGKLFKRDYYRTILIKHRRNKNDNRNKTTRRNMERNGRRR